MSPAATSDILPGSWRLTRVSGDVTRGHLCIKGRFGWEFVNLKPENAGTE